MKQNGQSCLDSHSQTLAGFKGLQGPPGETMVVSIKGEGGKQGPSGISGFSGPRGQSDVMTPLT